MPLRHWRCAPLNCSILPPKQQIGATGAPCKPFRAVKLPCARWKEPPEIIYFQPPKRKRGPKSVHTTLNGHEHGRFECGSWINRAKIKPYSRVKSSIAWITMIVVGGKMPGKRHLQLRDPLLTKRIKRSYWMGVKTNQNREKIWRVKDICMCLGIRRSTLYNWIKKANSRGALDSGPTPEPGRMSNFRSGSHQERMPESCRTFDNK